jgi:hypothetical protein
MKRKEASALSEEWSHFANNLLDHAKTRPPAERAMWVVAAAVRTDLSIKYKDIADNPKAWRLNPDTGLMERDW